MSTPVKQASVVTRELLELNCMRPPDAAVYTGLSESTLAKLRMRDNRRNGPGFIKVAGCVIYRRQDLDEWIESHAVKAA